MCDFEEYIFICKHNTHKLKVYCHQSRNHPRHECNKVKRLCNSWYQKRLCDVCTKAASGAGPSSGGGSAPGPGGRRQDPHGPFANEMGVLQ